MSIVHQLLYMYERVLLPTDGSSAALPAVRRAIDLTTQYDAELHVLHVVEEPPFSGSRSLIPSLREKGEHVVANVRRRAERGGVEEVITHVARGTPHRTIVEYVTDHQIDLVIMGTHGRTGLDRFLLGSVTEKVVRMSPVPVLTVPRDVGALAVLEKPEAVPGDHGDYAGGRVEEGEDDEGDYTGGR